MGRVIKVVKKTIGVIKKGRRPPLYIPLERLFLDPENPRLSEAAQGGSEEELMKVLAKSFNLDELADSMAENGYFDEEPLVGIPQNVPKKLLGDEHSEEYQRFLKNEKTKFTVVEGNRRVAAAKLLLNEELRKTLGLRMWPQLREGVAESLKTLPVIVYPERSWVVPYLGVRHIIGIQKWDSYARATYVARMVKDGRKLEEIEQQIGDRKGSVKKIYFCYRLIEEVEEQFDLNTDRAKNYFSYLVLSSGQGTIRDFLGVPRKWADVNFEKPVAKAKLGNLKELFSWLFGEGKSTLPVIRESRDITNKLAPVLRNDEATRHLSLTRDIDDAYERSDGEKELLLKNLKKANRSLEKSLSLVPQYKIEEVEIETTRCLDTINAILKLLKD